MYLQSRSVAVVICGLCIIVCSNWSYYYQMLMVTVFDSSDILLLIGTVAPTKHWVIYIDLWLPWLYIYIYRPLRVLLLLLYWRTI